MKRVVVTGIGLVFGDDFTNEDFFKDIYAGKCFAKQIPEDYGYSCKCKWYVPFPDTAKIIELEPQLSKFVKRSNKSSIAAAYAALKAVGDASIELPEDTGVIMGNVMNISEIATDAELLMNGKRISPMAIPKYMTNACAANISILFGIHGACKVISTACASGTDAVGEAYQAITYGDSHVMIAGGAECFIGSQMFRGFDMLKTLTSTDDGVPYAFCEERSGFLYSEGGGCCLILEELEHAKARGARIYAEITGYCCNSDGYHITGMPEYPENAIKLVKSLSDKKIDYYNAHGTGTNLNDSAESQLIKSIWGEEQPMINTTKGIMGHTFSASGAIETAICAYSIYNQMVHGNLLKTPIEGLNLIKESTKTEINTAITASFGFGGHNAAIRLERIG